MSETVGAPPPGQEQGLARWTGWACDVAGCMLIALVVLVCAEIVARTAFGGSTLVSDEYSGYLFVWITLIGFAHALQLGTFLRVDNVVSLLGPRGRAITDLLAALAGVAVSAVCVYATGKLVLASLQFGTRSIQPSATPIWIPQVILPLGFTALVAVYMLLAGQAAARALRH